MKILAAISAFVLLAAAPASAELRKDVADDYGYVKALYEYLHANPELSFKEKESSKRLARELEALGFDVTAGVGSSWTKKKAKADAGEVLPGVGGYGVVGVLENGDGPTVMIRTDMDALPLEEKTGVSYASTVTSVDYLGQEAPVMHACGHDSHMAIWVGTARRLAAMKDQWSGTLVMIAQPAEEVGLGAMAMLEDKLFKRFPKPDYNLALHVTGRDPAGAVTYTSGWALANVDSVDIHVKGVGAHGSTPHLGKDPIVLSAEIINALQTLVARELDPQEAGVVTVGAIHAGFKHNIIPDEAHLKITVRSYSDDVRQKLLSGIERIARAQALSAGLPEDLLPVVKIEQDYTPSTYNDPELADRTIAAIRNDLGDKRVYAVPAVMGGEDFSLYGRTDDDIPSFIFWVGAADPEAIAAAKEGEGPMPPSNHSPFFAPIPEPTLKTGVEAMTAAALDLMAAKTAE